MSNRKGQDRQGQSNRDSHLFAPEEEFQLSSSTHSTNKMIKNHNAPIGNVSQNQETAAVAVVAPTGATRKDSDQKSAAGLVHSVPTLRAGSLRRRNRADRAIDRVGAVERLRQGAGDPAAVGRLHLVGLVDAASLIPEGAQTFRSGIDEQ